MTCKTAGNCRWGFEIIQPYEYKRIHTLVFSQSFNHMLLICFIQRRIIEHCHVQPFACRYDILPQAADTTVRHSSAALNRHPSSFISQSSGLHSLVLFASSSNLNRASFSQIISDRRTQSQLSSERLAPYICPLLIHLSQQCLRETKTGFPKHPGGGDFS